MNVRFFRETFLGKWQVPTDRHQIGCLVQPFVLFANIFEIILSPRSNVDAVGISVLIAGILLFWYLVYVNLRVVPPPASPSPVQRKFL